MEIYFDKATTRVLRYIRWHKNTTLGQLQAKFGDDANIQLIVDMCAANYLVCKRPDGSYTMFHNGEDSNMYHDDTFWVSPKGKKLLEDRFDRLWQWSIPTVISVAALIVSILAA